MILCLLLKLHFRYLSVRNAERTSGILFPDIKEKGMRGATRDTEGEVGLRSIRRITAESIGIIKNNF